MKKILLTAIATTLALPLFAFAQTAVPTAVQANIDKLSSINQQITALEQQRNAVLSSITLSLKQGSQGDQVKIIQALLASDPSIYPEGVISGFYGALTAKAVKRFQEKNGLESVGSIGPKTRQMFNELLNQTPIMFGVASTTATTTMFRVKENDDNKENQNSDNGNKHPCVIVPPGHLIAPGWMKKNKGDDHPIVPPCQVIPKGIEKKLENDREENDHQGNGDKTAPVLSSISASAATSSATISWTTNEVANTSVVFGTTASYGMAASIDGMIASHVVTLTGLLPATMYNYQVKSVDQSGNVATSANLTFTTSPVAVVDTTAPVISNVASTVASTTASVMWATNEPSTSKVYFATTTPVSVATAMVAQNSVLISTHLVPLPVLSAATTYYYLVNSVDAAGNSATLPEQSLTTTQ